MSLPSGSDCLEAPSWGNECRFTENGLSAGPAPATVPRFRTRAWELLTSCLLVEPDGDVLAVRGRRSEPRRPNQHDHPSSEAAIQALLHRPSSSA
jgi:hypothetical protein